MSLTVVDDSGKTEFPGRISSIKINMKRPDVVSPSTIAAASNTSDAVAKRATDVANLVLDRLSSFAEDSEALGLLVGTSLIAKTIGSTPPALRAHLLTLIGLESGMRKNAKNPSSSASGYLQFVSGSRKAYLSQGERAGNLLKEFLPQGDTALLTSALTVMGMWMHYFEEIQNHWRYSPITGWTPSTNLMGAVNSYLTSHYKEQLKDREAGLQLLFTALHFYGSAFSLSKDKRLSSDLNSRFAVDSLLFKILRDKGKEITTTYLKAVERRIPTSYNSKIVQFGDVGGDTEPVVTSNFQKKRRASNETKARAHKGIDLRAPEGTPIFPPRKSVIESIRMQRGPFAYGLYLTLRADDGRRYRYAHLSRISDDVREGSIVEPGDVIGWTGKSGTVHAHLHFEYFPEGSDVQADPLTDPTSAWKNVLTDNSSSTFQ